MGQGRELGLQLRHWLDQGRTALNSGHALANALCDGLGEQELLKGPVRDLGSRPLFLQLLRQSGATQRSNLVSLKQQLATTYSPSVLAELLDLLEAVTGQELDRSDLQQGPDPAEHPQEIPAEKPVPAWCGFGPELRSLAPGITAAAAAAAVIAWLAQELQRLVFGPWGWSSGVALAACLGLLQALSLGAIGIGWRRRWSLDHLGVINPRQAWRWITAPWIHANGCEAAANLLLLLIVLGPTPLPLGQVVLRYCLTALAAQIPAALMARRQGIARRWSGAAAPLSALVGLAAGLSLLQGRSLGFPLGPLRLPAWVLLLVYGSLQVGWLLPRQAQQEQSLPLQRLMASTASWGLLLGLAWALISWLQQLITQR
jgi:membrane associated rhomboid family serine protease